MRRYLHAMADQKPRRFAGDERTTVLALLQYQRDSFVRKVSGVGDEEAAMSPVGSGTSLLWLTNHIADAETTWVLQRFAARSDPSAAVGHAASIGGAIRRYEEVWRDVDTVVAGMTTLDQECPAFDDQPVVNLRWILVHLLEETARHAGHADILREIVDGSTGR